MAMSQNIEFEKNVTTELLKIARSAGLCGNTLLSSDDIDRRWKELAPEYMADAVPEVQRYPTVSVAWAAYLGIGVACGWDKDWVGTQNAAYQSFYGSAGFDDMDEHITRDLLGVALDSKEAEKLESTIRSCAETAIAFIRGQHVAPQTPEAFHVFAHACRAMYRIGASMALHRLGYRIEKL
jgi:hypothetical protein